MRKEIDEYRDFYLDSFKLNLYRAAILDNTCEAINRLEDARQELFRLQQSTLNELESYCAIKNAIRAEQIKEMSVERWISIYNKQLEK